MRIAFYVALTDKACDKQMELIQSMKHLLPIVGIIRVKNTRICRRYLKVNGKKDFKLAEAVPTNVKIIRQNPEGRRSKGTEGKS